MNYYLDIGNTNTTLYFDDNKINLETIKDESMFFYLKEYLVDLEKSSLFIVSVVPELDNVIRRLNKSAKYFLQLSPLSYNQLMEFNGPDISQMGADRVVLDVYFSKKYTPNCIIIDMGTAITVDVIKDGTYISGYIYPGFATSLLALIGNASLLENIQYNDLSNHNICLTSETQINDGLIIGTIGAINNLVSQSFTHFNDEVEVFITGGYFNLLNELLKPEKLGSILKFKYKFKKDVMLDAMKYIEEELRNIQ